MKSETEIRTRLEDAERDERLSYPSATIFENAPLALIQIELETIVSVIKWVLTDDETDDD